MPSRLSCRLVVDASVAHAAGGREAIHTTASHCRDCLLAILEVCHQLVMTPAITEEWNKHQSCFARTWRVSMEARKKVARVDTPADDALRTEIAARAKNERDRQAILNDMHLIEAALAADQAIIALDETVRHLLHAAAESVGVLRTVMWVNPTVSEEDCVSWLRAKAKREKQRLLGCQAEE